MATKKELEQTIKDLKQQVRDLKGQVKETESDLEGLDKEAHSIAIYDKNYHLITIAYDVESNKAAIKEVKKLEKNKAMVLFKLKTTVVDHLAKEMKENL